MIVCGKAMHSKTHILIVAWRECEMYAEKRYVLEEEIRDIHECHMDRSLVH